MESFSICQEIVKKIQSLINSFDFLHSFCEEKSFVRLRKWSLSHLVLFLFFPSKASMQTNLANFSETFASLSLPKISKQAISKARQHIKPELFQTLFRFSVQQFYEKRTRFHTWHGYSLLAIDGSSLQLPNHPRTKARFGVNRNQHKSREDAMASVSILYDVLEDLVVDTTFSPYHFPERKAAQMHVKTLQAMGWKRKTILLLDRGYPSYDLFQQMQEAGLFFVMRVQKNNYQLNPTNTSDSLVEYLPVRKKKNPPIRVRVLHLPLPNGKKETLVTNLLGGTFSSEQFRELYFQRWRIEGKFNELKNQWELEEFSGATPISIQQDYFITLLFSNLCAMMKQSVDHKIQEERKPTNRFSYQTNRAFLIGQWKQYLAFLLAGLEAISNRLEKIFALAKERRSQIQPNRTQKRPRMQLRRRHCNNRKTVL